MKTTFYIVIIVLLFACGNRQQQGNYEPKASEVTERFDSVNQEAPFELNGTWALTNYFDTIVSHRELAKYRMQRPTWFAILLQIENDTLYSYGSIMRDKYPINSSSDTLGIVASLTSKLTGDSWSLVVKPPYLQLLQLPSKEVPDTTVYLFRKREDFYAFTKENKDFFVIGNNVTDYFNQQLFEGPYINATTQEKVVFDKNRALIGVNGYHTYAVRNYFGTLHMFKNLDVITFEDTTNNDFALYNWVFEGDTLLLTEFVYEQVTHEGVVYESDYFVPKGKQIVLVRE